MLARVRNRRGVVAAVEPFDGRDERLHLVTVEYTDADGVAEDTLLWEREHNASLVPPAALPRVEDEPAMPSADFDALVRATRWGAMRPYLDPDGAGPLAALPVAAPFHGAVQVEDFQLVPLLQALRMPRVSLLLADDVGLGKTVEAGLILSELLLRRRIRRVLVLCPSSLRQQWQQEMDEKFSLSFDAVDRAETYALQKRIGLDANPWRTYPRIVASYHYLRQDDVLEQFRSACRQPEGAATLPWDLLIVDEAHNLMPASFGKDSALAEMLRQISPYFEHKLFLTATPHNGHTRSFSGLLQQLDPVRFTQTSELTATDRERVEQIVIRRLKSEINELDAGLGRPRRFAERHVAPQPLYFARTEAALSAAVEAFRVRVRSEVATRKADLAAGSFAVEVLNKRLLSCPATFAESWHRLRQGLDEAGEADAVEVAAARRGVDEEVEDDREREGRERHAARTVGSWLKPVAGRLAAEIASVDDALARLELAPPLDDAYVPSDDARFDRLVDLIRHRLRSSDDWLADERLVVFTEYKTTLDYVERRLRDEFGDDGTRVRVLFGGLDARDREEIKRAFNDPADPVRVLVATDAASEGLNLQETARLLLHYDVPWNPSRLEQRNGRLDRHGQARDVTVYHFTSEDEADLNFLGYVVGKVDHIRDDLGSVGEVFDAAFQRRFVDLEDAASVARSLDEAVEQRRRRAEVPRLEAPAEGAEELARLAALCQAVDLSPETLRATLEVALGLGVGLPRLEGPDGRGRFRVSSPIPPAWVDAVDETLRLRSRTGERGPLRSVVFDPSLFVRTETGRPVFRPEKDTVLLHLGHPLFKQALATFARTRFTGGAGPLAPSRWTARPGAVPAGADALVLLTVEELAVNDLREPFHHWVRTIRIPVEGGRLGEPLPWIPAAEDTCAGRPDDALVDRARAIWDDVAGEVPALLDRVSAALTDEIRETLEVEGQAAVTTERERFRSRVGEVREAIKRTTIKRIERERDRLVEDMRTMYLFADLARSKQQELEDLDAELRRRQAHYAELIVQLEAEQQRVLDRVLPRRYALRGAAQVFPVAVELRLPEGPR